MTHTGSMLVPAVTGGRGGKCLIEWEQEKVSLVPMFPPLLRVPTYMLGHNFNLLTKGRGVWEQG